MEIKKEKSFPRGGVKKAFIKKIGTQDFSFNKQPATKKKLKIARSKKAEIAVGGKLGEKKFEIQVVEDLKTTEIQNGMILLGIVSKVSKKYVQVSLPGKLGGVISHANVSDQYKTMIGKSNSISDIPSLQQLFKVGSILPVKILKVSQNHSSFDLTSDPKLINCKLSHNLIETGMVLSGSVKSVEDHGYVIDFGINNLNGFLHFNNVKKDKSLIVGQIIRCCVINCTKSQGSSYVQLSALKSAVQTSVPATNSLPVYNFTPGLQLKLQVEKVLKEGVEVSYGYENSNKAYIYDDHLENLFPKLSKIEVGDQYIGTLLYIKPLVNSLYFKVMPKKAVTWPFEFGQIVSGKVIKSSKAGVMFKVREDSKKAKCFVPISQLQESKSLRNINDIKNQYPVNKEVTEIRLRSVNYLNRFYYGTTIKESINEKYFSLNDLKCGEIVTGVIQSFSKGSACVLLGKKIKSIVDFKDMTDVPLSNPTTKFKVGQKVKARVLEVNPESLFLRLTMKPTLLKEKKILCDAKKCDINGIYTGTVVFVNNFNLIVKFFNNVVGIVPKKLTPFANSTSLEENYSCGQLLKCCVLSNDEEKLLLSLNLKYSESNLQVGQKYSVKVIKKEQNGLFLYASVNQKTCIGFLPKELLTTHWSLATPLLSTYDVGEKFFAYCISINKGNDASIFGTADVFEELYEGKSEKDLKNELKVNAVLPFLYGGKSQKFGGVFLTNILPGMENTSVKVAQKDDLKHYNTLTKYRILYGKVLNISGNNISVSTKLSDVWEKNLDVSLNFLDSYLLALEGLITRQKNKLEAYSKNVELGSVVKGIIEEVRSNAAVVKTEDGDLGLIEGHFKAGEEVCGKVVWIDTSQQIIHIKQIRHHENDKANNSIVDTETDKVKGKVVFISDETVVLNIRGPSGENLAFFPRRRHLNDFVVEEIFFKVGDKLNLWITTKTKHVLAMERRIVSVLNDPNWKESEMKLKHTVESLKKKLSLEKEERRKKQKTSSQQEDEVEVVSVMPGSKKNGAGTQVDVLEIKEEVDACDETFQSTTSDIPRLEYDDIDIKSEADIEEQNGFVNGVRDNDERILLSSSSESEDEETVNKKDSQNSTAFNVGFNWNVTNAPSLLSGITFNKEESSDDEDDEMKNEKRKKRKLTASEVKEKAKMEEERLRAIEERLMDTKREPETIDDFDRAVLGNPDSSALWLKYMAFHVQNTEIEKARAVAGRALKAISFREEQEKLNIWIALLNLENMYGNEDSLNKTLNEALKLNEPYKVHLHMLNLYGQSNRLRDMEKLGNFMVKKYKDLENVWYDLGTAFFNVGKVETARNIMQKAVTVIHKSQRIALITKFAQLENKFGSPERAQTLYESILGSFPKRVDIWCSYVDMLVKSNLIDLARQVLERATSQSIRPKKMKTLFKKFITFEETHGTPETVEKVREAAVDYVQTVGAMDD